MRLLHFGHDPGRSGTAERNAKSRRHGCSFTNAEASVPLLQLSDNTQSRSTRGERGQEMISGATKESVETKAMEAEYEELFEPVGYDFGLKRRSFMQILGAGLL